LVVFMTTKMCIPALGIFGIILPVNLQSWSLIQTAA